jgi:hypothetical protein
MVFAEIACCELLRSQAFYMLGYLRDFFNYMSWFASSGFVFDERLLTAKVLRIYFITCVPRDALPTSSVSAMCRPRATRDRVP